jgi:plastocyanin
MRNCGRLAMLLVGAALLSPAVLASPAVGEPGSSPTVTIQYSMFNPDNLEVPVGTTVTWVNKDNVEHSVTSEDKGGMQQSVKGNGGSFRHTFDRPGDYPYYCHWHSSMKGTVHVR